jgi:pyruvate/2-oxoglutarate dehydrogenase complex dihydrolipoamide acyltransferase (E2) component
MMVRNTLAVGICLLGATAGWAQALPTAATIESIPLELTMPEKYHVTSVLEPIRRVSLVTPADGIIRSINAPLGATVRASQEIAQLDRAEATAKLKMAQAEVKEKQAMLKTTNQTYQAFYTAQLEAAQAKVEIAQLELSRLTLSAPFAGRIIALPVSSGQYVLKGTVIAELADLTSLKSLVPVDRRTVTEGSEAKVFVEEQAQNAKIQTILPLPESHASLRDLAAPFASAWVVIANTKGDLAPGLRVRSATLPITPLATVPKDSIKTTEGTGASGGPMVQVLRNEYVTNVPVNVLGKVGAERFQVTGALRTTDALIVSSSVALLPGTLVRFAGSARPGIEGSTPSPARQGAPAGITPPTGANSSTDPFGGPTAPRSGTSHRRGRNVAPPPVQGGEPF